MALFRNPHSAERGVSKMWRSKASSTLTLLVTLAMINYFSKPQEAEERDASKADRLLSGSKSKARVDMVRKCRWIYCNSGTSVDRLILLK